MTDTVLVEGITPFGHIVELDDCGDEPTLDRSIRSNWVERTGGLPCKINEVAKDLHYERGMAIGHAIEVAVGVNRDWCHGHNPGGWSAGHKVKPKTQAAGCAAAAEWEARKAMAHASGGSKKKLDEEDEGLGLITFRDRSGAVHTKPMVSDRHYFNSIPGYVPIEHQERERIVAEYTGKAKATAKKPKKPKRRDASVTETSTDTIDFTPVEDGAVDEEGIELASFSDKPWDGSASRFGSTEAYCSSCLIDNNPAGQPKSQSKCHLPIKEPGGAINKAAIRSALARVNQVKDISAEQRASARSRLQSLARQAGIGGSDSKKTMSEHFADWLRAGLALFASEGASEEEEGVTDDAVEANSPGAGEPAHAPDAGGDEGGIPGGVPEVTAADATADAEGTEGETPVNLAYQLPLTEWPAYELESPDEGKRRFKRAILPVGAKINYEKGGVKKTLNFTRDLLDRMIANAKDKAFAQVPFLAMHPKDPAVNPDHYYGEVVGLDRDDAWLYGIFETTERGAKLLQENPKLPVSVGFFENYFRRADEKKFGPTLQHVAATYTPYVPSLGDGWAKVLSEENEADEVVDLTGAHYGASDEPGKESGPVSATPTHEETREGVPDEMEQTPEARETQQVVTLEDFEATKAELAETRRILREQSVERMLDGYASIEVDGKRFAMPPAKRKAFKAILSALEGSENDPIVLSASGASVKEDDPLGFSEALTPWEAIPLGEEGSNDVTPVDDNDDDAKEARIQALADEQEISWAEAAIQSGEGVF